MIQDDHRGGVVDHDHPLEETTFPSSPVVTGQEDKDSADPEEVLQQPKRKRGRPRKYQESPPAEAPGKKDRRKKERCSCNIIFKSTSSLRRHMNKFHGQHACQLCNLTFHTEQEL